MTNRPLIGNYIDDALLTPISEEELNDLLQEDHLDGEELIAAFLRRFGRTDITCDPTPGYSAYDWWPVDIIQVTSHPEIVTLTQWEYSKQLYRTIDLKLLVSSVRTYNHALATFYHERTLSDLRSVPRSPRDHYDLPKDGYTVLPPPYNKWSEILTRDYGKILVFPFRSPLSTTVTYFEVGDSLYLTADGEWPRHLAYGELLANVTPCEVP